MSSSAFVVVLGDLGRSPRMLNHAVSLAEGKNVRVSLIGYAGSALPSRVKASRNIAVTHVAPFMQISSGNAFLKLIIYVLKTLWNNFFPKDH